MSVPDQQAVEAQIAAFDAALAQARSPRDAHSVRDRFLGRKHSIVASWMQLIATPPGDRKKPGGRSATELKRARGGGGGGDGGAAGAPAPAGAIDVTLPGRPPFVGHRHPLTVVRDRVEDIFTRMGFA